MDGESSRKAYDEAMEQVDRRLQELGDGLTNGAYTELSVRRIAVILQSVLQDAERDYRGKENVKGQWIIKLVPQDGRCRVVREYVEAQSRFRSFKERLRGLFHK